MNCLSRFLKGLIEKSFDGNTLKMKTKSSIYVTKSKKLCFQLLLDQGRLGDHFGFAGPFFACLKVTYLKKQLKLN